MKPNNQLLRSTATFIFALYLALLQSGMVSFASSQLGRPKWLMLISSAICVLGVLLSAASIPSGKVPRNHLLAVGSFALLAFVPLVLHLAQTGIVTKAYVIGVGSIVGLYFTARSADLRRLAQFSASIVCVASIGCLLDLCFADGFTNSAGRAAFLYINCNIAALALVLGAVATAWSVPLRWLPSFLILVGGGIFATLSRSGMLVAGVTVLACFFAVPFPELRSKAREMAGGWRQAASTFALVASLLGVAFAHNEAFPVAMSDSFHGVYTVFQWLKPTKTNARSSVDASATSASHAQTPVPVVVSSIRAPAEQVQSQTIKQVEQHNSASARILLAERGWRQFREGPATGIGLEKAFELTPHNFYILLADAFGYVGWTIIPALIGLVLFLGGRKSIPAACAIAVSAAFSHDLLFAMPLVSPLVLLLATASRVETKERTAEASRNGFAYAATLIFAISAATGVMDAYQTTYHKHLGGNEIRRLAGSDFYYVPLADAVPAGIFRIGASGSEIFNERGISITEDGKPIQISFKASPSIGQDAGGSYAFGEMSTVFSPAGGSDTNGHDYVLNAPVTVHPLLLMMVLVSMLWCSFWVLTALGARLARDRFQGQNSGISTGTANV